MAKCVGCGVGKGKGVCGGVGKCWGKVWESVLRCGESKGR